MNNYKTLRQVYEELGVSRRVIQRYEKAGLVYASGRNKYGHLLYDEEMQQKIKQVCLYQQMGFQLKEIKALLEAPVEEQRIQLQKKERHLKEECKQKEALIQQLHQMIQMI